MVTQTMRLDESATVTLDVDGDGTARIGPINPGQTWKITTLAVSVDSNNRIPQARVYADAGPSPAAFLGGTENGARDQMGPDLELLPGQQVTVVWDGGDPGARATVSVAGTKTAGTWA